MAFKNIRTLIRIDYTPISDTKVLSEKLRSIDGFYETFSDYNYFKIGDTSNYRNGNVNELEPEELVYRYSKEQGGLNVVLDFTSRFFYIRLIGEELSSDVSEYFRIMEDVTKLVLENDKFVKITNYGIGKEFEEKKAELEEVDKIERDSYTAQPQNVRIIYQERNQRDAKRYTIIASVNEVAKNPDYSKGEKLYDKAFMIALKEAEEKYG